MLKSNFKTRSFKESFKNATYGIFYLFFHHRNMRIIFLLGILAFLLGIYFKLKGIELVILCITITTVFMAEIFNTAIEKLMDMVSTQYHQTIKLIKDIAAAVVLISCLNSLAVGYVLFLRKIFK